MVTLNRSIDRSKNDLAHWIVCCLCARIEFIGFITGHLLILRRLLLLLLIIIFSLSLRFFSLVFCSIFYCRSNHHNFIIEKHSYIRCVVFLRLNVTVNLCDAYWLRVLMYYEHTRTHKHNDMCLRLFCGNFAHQIESSIKCIEFLRWMSFLFSFLSIDP